MAELNINGHTVLFDDEDLALVSQYKWRITKSWNTPYASAHTPRINGKRSGVLMHRLIMGAPKGVFVDHKDRNGINNKRSNLRLCTNGQNIQNSKGRKNSKSKFKGISFCKKTGKWAVSVTKDKKRIWVGRFADEIVAAKAYDEAAKKYFGEFARTNEL